MNHIVVKVRQMQASRITMLGFQIKSENCLTVVQLQLFRLLTHTCTCLLTRG